MSDLAIRVQNLGKRYRIGEVVGYKTLRDTMMNAVLAPFGRRSRPEGKLGQASNVAGYIWALKDVSFDVKRGEVVGIIGSNGAGKRPSSRYSPVSLSPLRAPLRCSATSAACSKSAPGSILS